MKRFLVIAAIAVAAVFLLIPSAQAQGHRAFAMNAQNGSAESGAVLLTPLGDKTRVEIVLANSPSGIAQPAHVHEGPCAKLNPKPKWGLASVVDGYSVTTINVPMDTLVGANYAVNVHKSGSEIGTYVSCGDLK